MTLGTLAKVAGLRDVHLVATMEGTTVRTMAFAFALTVIAFAGNAYACGGMMSASTATTTVTADAAPIQTPVVTAPQTGS